MPERTPKITVYPKEIRGMGIDQAESWLLSHGGIPNWWCDPILQAKALGTSLANVVVDAHLNQFEQSYANRLGKNARGIGYSRNIEGQGFPNDKPKKRR